MPERRALIISDPEELDTLLSGLKLLLAKVRTQEEADVCMGLESRAREALAEIEDANGNG